MTGLHDLKETNSPPVYVLPFDSPDSVTKATVGGKGANLGALTQANFPVPEGFTITTSSYRAFVDQNGLTTKLLAIVDKIDFDDAEEVERETSKMRQLVMQTPMPLQVTAPITSYYSKLGSSPYVAVRSSGTAEDLAEASFAGLHDTLLDIRGPEAVIDAVRECWASLWSGRATSYRQRNGFGHSEVDIAVVVQRMVASDVSGVMFTGNPLTSATDEIVINSSWGLGEALVSGMINPDNFVLKTYPILRIRDRVLGDKEKAVRRDSRANGTKVEVVEESERVRFSLSDHIALKLARLGLRIQEHYDGFPQDIEWGIEKDEIYILQSRPITGVEFSWDADLEDWQMFPEVENTTWTRSVADENWTGAISPLMYTTRGYSWAQGHECAAELWGVPELQGKRKRFHLHCVLALANIPKSWHQDVQDATFSWISYLKLYARVEALRPQLYRGFDLQNKKWRHKFSTEGKGIPRAELKELSDRDLKNYVNRQLGIEDEYTRDMWTWFFIMARDMLTLLSVLLHHWYDPEDKMAFQAILTGTPRASETQKQNHMLWKLSQIIHKSSTLSANFAKYEGKGFLDSCNDSDDGRAFLESYTSFLQLYGQRGMPDRDIYFPRRCEDPAIDYLALQAMLKTADAPDPAVKEHEMNRVREEYADKVLAKVQRSVLGLFKAELLKIGPIMYGLFESEDDVWFLGKSELYHLWDTRRMTPLLRAKITGRRNDFDRMLKRETFLPDYLINSAAADLDVAEEAVDGVHRGIGTAKGKVTAKARVVRQLKDIGRVKEGEILIVNSTDPGWTPVFHIISGLVLETGGILAHGSCLAREYGLPAVQLGKAMELIPDGSLITVNGEASSVTILPDR
ncbi:hypothetical protein FE257_001198 [Aspergillus nanangensis]|uniref:Pyruvate, water dikinase n=1 Tax=Aspergillus nanangensis TaxID=2582783 RepID=A0AAD4CE76_ASPNN|nr:hypothetical protein FE257_001198 [Aspergillus nanangensis]